MKQREIKQRLQELVGIAHSRTSRAKRRAAIAEKVNELTFSFYGRNATHVRNAYGGLLQNLVEQYAAERPDSIPDLFPIFATLCGDTDGYFAPIDWSLAKRT